MKTVSASQAPAMPYNPMVKKHLIKGVIYLTSNKFSIFVGVIAALMCYIGVLLDDTNTIAFGGIEFIVGFTPWAIRQSLRDIRQEKLGLNNDKW